MLLVVDIGVDYDYFGTQLIMGRIVTPYARQKSERVANIARRKVPVDTGKLQRSIKISGPFDAGPNQVMFSVFASTPYAGFVHEGTRFMRRRPFLRDAMIEVFG